MVRLKFIVLNDAIVLRISEGYERYYKSVSIRPSTGAKFIYTNSGCHYTSNSCSRYCFVEPICCNQRQLSDSAFYFVKTLSGCCNFHLWGSRFNSSSRVAFL